MQIDLTSYEPILDSPTQPNRVTLIVYPDPEKREAFDQAARLFFGGADYQDEFLAGARLTLTKARLTLTQSQMRHTDREGAAWEEHTNRLPIVRFEVGTDPVTGERADPCKLMRRELKVRVMLHETPGNPRYLVGTQVPTGGGREWSLTFALPVD